MIAVIDIGSNSVRLMLWADGAFYKRVNTTRLGEGIAETGRLSPQAIERTARAVAEYAEEGTRQGAAVYAFATAAVRSAQNGVQFCERVKQLANVDVDVVSGEEEALLGLCGALGLKRSFDPKRSLRGAIAGGATGGVVDIGGASAEVCLCREGKPTFSVSLDVGAVRLYDLCRDDPAALRTAVERETAPLEGVKGEGKIYAIGGTCATLAALKLGMTEFDERRIQDLPMSLGEISALCGKLAALTAEERRLLPGMDARRADIITGGAFLLEAIMKKMSLAEVYGSAKDNLEGYLCLRGLI